jgi:hypothetical protein
MHSGVSYSSGHPTSRHGYEDVNEDGELRMISHIHGCQEGEPEGIWEQLLCYLKDGELPVDCDDAIKRRKFLK